MKFPPVQLSPGFLTPRQLLLNSFPLYNCPSDNYPPMKFPPVKLSPGYFDPPDNYSWIIFPWTTAPRTINSHEIPSRTIIPRIFPPMQLPLNNSHLDSCSPDNYPLSNSLQDSYPLDFFPHTIHNYLWIIPPWTTTPQIVASNGSPPQGQLSPRLLPSRQLLLNSFPLEHKPSQTQLPHLLSTKSSQG